MADSSINSFMSNFDGGSRPNLYSVNLVCPVGPLPQLQFYCKAATLPSSILGEVNVPYLGRMAKYPGDRQFEDWTIDIINDQNMSLRNVFEYWNELFNSYAGNSTPFPNPRGAFGSAVVTQLNRAYQPVKSYQFFDLWPDNVASVQLGYDQNDTVSDFQVVFKYSYFVTSSSPFQVNGANIPGAVIGPGGVAAASAGAPFGGFGGLGGFGLGSGAGIGVGGPNGGAAAGAGGGNTSIAFGINTGSTSFGFGIST
jgi:hypothetical protein